MIVVVSTENFGDFKGFPVLNAFQETLILDTVCISHRPKFTILVSLESVVIVGHRVMVPHRDWPQFVVLQADLFKHVFDICL